MKFSRTMEDLRDATPSNYAQDDNLTTNAATLSRLLAPMVVVQCKRNLVGNPETAQSAHDYAEFDETRWESIRDQLTQFFAQRQAYDIGDFLLQHANEELPLLSQSYLQAHHIHRARIEAAVLEKSKRATLTTYHTLSKVRLNTLQEQLPTDHPYKGSIQKATKLQNIRDQIQQYSIETLTDFLAADDLEKTYLAEKLNYQAEIEAIPKQAMLCHAQRLATHDNKYFYAVPGFDYKNRDIVEYARSLLKQRQLEAKINDCASFEALHSCLSALHDTEILGDSLIAKDMKPLIMPVQPEQLPTLAKDNVRRLPTIVLDKIESLKSDTTNPRP